MGQGLLDFEQPESGGEAHFVQVERAGCLSGPGLQAVEPLFKRTVRFLNALLKRSPDGHHFPHRLHLHSQYAVGPGKFFEIEAGHFSDHVIKRRLIGGQGLPRNIVGNFIEQVAHGQLGGDFGDRETGCFGRQRR